MQIVIINSIFIIEAGGNYQFIIVKIIISIEEVSFWGIRFCFERRPHVAAKTGLKLAEIPLLRPSECRHNRLEPEFPESEIHAFES